MAEPKTNIKRLSDLTSELTSSMTSFDRSILPLFHRSKFSLNAESITTNLWYLINKSFYFCQLFNHMWSKLRLHT